jgi:hypothetical protein
LSGTPADASRDFDSVITHESGHALGLLHPCEPGGSDGAPDCAHDLLFANTTMYPIYNPVQASLAPDDVAGDCFLYPSGSCEVTGCPSGTECRSGACLETCGATTCRPEERCTPFGCKPKGDCAGPDCDQVACTSDQPCPPGHRCLLGICRGNSPNGDPCSSPRDCAGGMCNGGSCSSPGLSCSAGEASSACTESGKLPFGAACSSADDCLGGQCLAGADSHPVCSRVCGADSPCPGGWICDPVNQTPVCRPLNFDGSGGCHVSVDRSAPRWAARNFVLLATVAHALRRIQSNRRRRSRVGALRPKPSSR